MHIDLNKKWPLYYHDDVINCKHFPRYWPFVRGIHRSPVNSLHKGQWRGALIFSLICVCINDWVNNRDASDLRRYRAHYDVTIMLDIIYKTAYSLRQSPNHISKTAILHTATTRLFLSPCISLCRCLFDCDATGVPWEGGSCVWIIIWNLYSVVPMTRVYHDMCLRKWKQRYLTWFWEFLSQCLSDFHSIRL